MDMIAESQQPLAAWYERAGVRRDPRRTLRPEDRALTAGLVVFPPSLVPVLQHPAVVALGSAERHRLLVEQLYAYLDFTVRFELEFVNVTAQRIATDGTGFTVPESLRLEAFGVYCDEGYHALYCADVLHQVEQATGVPCKPERFRAVARRLHDVLDRAPDGLADTSQLMLVVAFETLVTRILDEVPRDPSVISCVRELVLDHAKDETRHHAYFARLFGQLWRQLGPADRVALGTMLPDLLLAALTPDEPDMTRALCAVGVDPATAAAVVTTTYPPDQVLRGIRQTARATLRLFERTGLFTDPSIAGAFHDRGLIELKEQG